MPSRYEVREKVRAAKALAIRGEVKVPANALGETPQSRTGGDG